MDASIFDSTLSHTRRSDVSEKKEESSVVALRSLLNVFACGQVSSPRLYRLRLSGLPNSIYLFPPAALANFPKPSKKLKSFPTINISENLCFNNLDQISNICHSFVPFLQ